MSRAALIGTAVVASAGLHLAVAGLFPATEAPSSAGGAPAPAVVAGQSFADLAAGGAPRLPVTGDVQAAVQPSARSPAPAASRHESARPSPLTLREPVEARQSAPPSLAAGAAAPAAQARVGESGEPPASGEPEPPRAVEPPPAAVDAGGSELAPEAAPRPNARSESAVRQASSRAGNADRDLRRGGATPTRATARATARETGDATQADRPGRAAVESWRSRVLHTIQRQRRDRVRGRGTAHVSFTVQPSGAVTGISLSRSSGSARIDAAAISHIGRAGPFEPPPGGRPVSLLVAFEGRG